MSNVLSQQSSDTYIITIIVSILFTVLIYGIIPIIISNKRKKPITKKKYLTICYVANFFIKVIQVLLGNTSFVPYLIWTWIFSAGGVNTLKNRGILEENQISNDNSVKDESDIARENIIVQETCNVEVTSENEIENISAGECFEGLKYVNSDNYICDVELSDNTLNKSIVTNTASSDTSNIINEASLETAANNTTLNNGGKKGLFSKINKTTVLVVFLLVISFGANIFQFYNYKKTEKLITFQKQALESQKVLNKSLTDKIELIEHKAYSYDRIYDALSSGNIGYASNSFKASEGIILVNKNETNRKFSLTTNWSGSGTVSVDYSSFSAKVEFDNDSWHTSTTMTIKPRCEGVTTVTFSNSVNSQTFKVIIIVTE